MTCSGAEIVNPSARIQAGGFTVVWSFRGKSLKVGKNARLWDMIVPKLQLFEKKILQTSSKVLSTSIPGLFYNDG